MGLLHDFLSLEYRFRFLKGERLRHFQEEEIGRLLDYARLKSPWYAQILGREGPLPDFRSLPIMDKALFMENFDRINTCGFELAKVMDFALDMERRKDFLNWYRHPQDIHGQSHEYSVGLSSGTSGNKGLTITPRSLARRLPAVFAARGGLPLSLLPFRVIFILRVDNQAFRQINNPLMTLRYVHSMTPPEEIIQACNALEAKVIMGPPSVLRLLAPLAGKLETKVRLLISVAEVLHPVDRQRLEHEFACPVHQIYQTTEGPIASSCSRGSLHINEDLMYVELLDEQGRALDQAGQRSSTVLVTNLYNRVHPLVRYRMGDQVILGAPCPCGSGFRVIQEVVGRDDDVLWLKDSRDCLRPVFPDLFSRWIITHSDDILDFQVVQKDYGLLQVRLNLGQGHGGTKQETMILFQELEHRLRRELSAWQCGAPGDLKFEIREEAPLQAEPGQKYKRFVRLVPPGA